MVQSSACMRLEQDCKISETLDSHTVGPGQDSLISIKCHRFPNSSSGSLFTVPSTASGPSLNLQFPYKFDVYSRRIPRPPTQNRKISTFIDLNMMSTGTVTYGDDRLARRTVYLFIYLFLKSLSVVFHLYDSG